MVALNIAESKKPAGDSTVELKKWIETLFSVVINGELLTVSSLSVESVQEKQRRSRTL